MDEFPGILSRDFGLRPQGKAAPMSASKRGGFGSASGFGSGAGGPFPGDLLGGDQRSSHRPLGDDGDDIFFGGGGAAPPKYASASAAFASDPFFSMGAAKTRSSPSVEDGLSSPMSVSDKPVYDDYDGDIFSGVPGMNKGSILYLTRSRRPPSPAATTTTIRAVDAAQPFDYEAKASTRLEQSSRLKIAVVGFGNFGQFLSRTLVRQGHAVLAHSRSDYSDAARSLGCAAFFQDPHDLCEAHPDVVLLCTSILSVRDVIGSLPLHRLRRSTLFADVLSVKEFPRTLLLQDLPSDFDIVCTHPMFGPESGKDGWAGLPFVYEKVRVGPGEDRERRSDKFLDIFAKEGCRMVEMSCADHDRYAAETQFVTHTVGRMLAKLELDSRPINTKGYETLLQLVENTRKDSFDLYNGLFMYNKNSTELLDRMEVAFDSVKKELFGQLHDIQRKQLFNGDGTTS